MKPKKNASTSKNKKLHAGKKLEEQKPLSRASHGDISVTKVLDNASAK
jgi:hypothetical protein